MAPNGFGTRPICIFLTPPKSSISTLPASTCGIWPPNSTPTIRPHRSAGSRQKDKLGQGEIESLVAALRSLQPSHPDLVKTILTEANYFERNQERMRSPKFRQQGLFVGSGVIEAGCKTVIGPLKQSGMFWTVRGANAIIALRCCQLSGKLEDYWEARRA